MAKKTTKPDKSKRKERKSLLERDNGLCGIHLEGCRQPINPYENWTVDHIIPQKIYKHLELNQKEYNRHWNKQPMHRGCNAKRGIGYYRNWPQFTCTCHFLYFHNGHAYIYAQEDVPPHGYIAWVAHQFIHGVVTPQSTHPMHMGIILPEVYKTKTRSGFDYRNSGPIRGHLFPFIHPDRVMALNAMALAPTGELHAIATWVGEQLEMLRPMLTTGGPTPEENFLVTPDIPGLGVPAFLPLSIAIPRDALLNWLIPPLSSSNWERITPTPRNKMPKEATRIRWAGGAPPPTKTDEISKAVASWFSTMGITVQTEHTTKEQTRTAQHTANVKKLQQWQQHIPDKSFGRLIPPLLTKGERRAFPPRNIAPGGAEPPGRVF